MGPLYAQARRLPRVTSQLLTAPSRVVRRTTFVCLKDGWYGRSHSAANEDQAREGAQYRPGWKTQPSPPRCAVAQASGQLGRPNRAAG